MAFEDDIETRMTALASRSGTLTKLEGDAAQKTIAAVYASTLIQNMYGTITDGTTDPIALEHGVLVAIRHMRSEVPFKVDPVIQRSLDMLDDTLENEMKRRKQLNTTPRQTDFSDSTYDSLFPFRNT